MFFVLIKEKRYSAYISKYNSNHERQFIPLMISNWERWHYIAVEQLPAILGGITSKQLVYFYCLNCLHSFRIENKLKLHKNVFENIFCNIVMPSKETKILEFNQYQKSDKANLTNILNVY